MNSGFITSRTPNETNTALITTVLQEGLMGNGFGQASLEDKDGSKFSLVHAIHCRVCMTCLL